jgi:hypothetical protein
MESSAKSLAVKVWSKRDQRDFANGRTGTWIGRQAPIVLRHKPVVARL